MKRRHISDELKRIRSRVSRYYSIFRWRLCERCRMDFRRERGFKIYITGFSVYQYNYLCFACAPDIAHAYCYAEKLFMYKGPRITEGSKNDSENDSSAG